MGTIVSIFIDAPYGIVTFPGEYTRDGYSPEEDWDAIEDIKRTRHVDSQAAARIFLELRKRRQKQLKEWKEERES